MKPTEHIFGNSKLNKIKTGDLSADGKTILPGKQKANSPTHKENIGIVTNVLVEQRGGRDVAMAKVIPLDNN